MAGRFYILIILGRSENKILKMLLLKNSSLEFGKSFNWMLGDKIIVGLTTKVPGSIKFYKNILKEDGCH